MESMVEDIVMVGAGISGLATSLALYRCSKFGVRVSWNSLRFTGFALTICTNAWRVLDALGVGPILRKQHIQISGCVAEAFSAKPDGDMEKKKDDEEKEEYKRIEGSLKKFADERRWRSLSYVVDFVPEGESKWASFLRDKSVCILSWFSAKHV